MVKIENEEKIYELIHLALRQTISNHGVIHLGLCRSATKRILGAIKTYLHNQNVTIIKRERTDYKNNRHHKHGRT